MISNVKMHEIYASTNEEHWYCIGIVSKIQLLCFRGHIDDQMF